MDEDNKGKNAAEAVGLFQLFNRMGKSFYGWLLLEIRWLFLLWLATKVIPGSATALTPPVPATISFSPFHIGFPESRITKIAVVGGLFVLLGWFVYSRLSHYVFKPIGLILQILLRWFVVGVSFLVFLLESLRLTIVWPITRLLIYSTENNTGKSGLQNFNRHALTEMRRSHS